MEVKSNRLVTIPFQIRFKIGVLLLMGAICIGITACQPKKQDNQHTTWKDYGGSPDQSKFVKMSGNVINKSNVDQLKEAWFYPTGDDHVYQFNPLIVDTVMYVLAHNNSLVALNAKTGKEIWIHTDLRGIARRGINYWESADGTDKRLLFQMNDYLQAIDAETGKSILSFGNKGLVDLRKGLGRDPKTISRVQSGTPGKIYKNLIILGSAPGENYLVAPGHIRAYNVITGKREWIFHTIPQPGEFGYDTWPKDAYKYTGGVNCWGEMSLDKKRGIVYIPLGSPTYDYYGADRHGKDLFGTSIVALNAKTGKRLWHFQLVHHDLWDFDPSAAPQLITVNHKGKEVPAVALADKNGYLYVFNRVTGKPIWPIKEQKVPSSNIPGEQAWPTQPIPTKPKPFARHRINPDSLNPYHLTKEEQNKWHDKLIKLQNEDRTGLFTPLSNKKQTISVPGAVGGANWGNTAANPDKGIVYVISKAWPSIYPPLQKKAFGKNAEQRPGGYVNPVKAGLGLYKKNCQTCHGSNRQGIGSAPSLKSIETRLSFEDFQHTVSSGRGEMPSFSFLSKKKAEEIYRYLGGTRGGSVVKPPKGPVVASGGAPGGQKYRPAERSGGRLGPPYPKGVDAPSVRYYMNGWGLGYDYLMSPPWTYIVAYDLNKGTIKWRRPLGTDELAAKKGGNNTGVIGAQRNGMIVTSTGLLFSTAGDGKVYAFDAETGKQLWMSDLPTGTEGLPSMYKLNGKYYLVVTDTTPLEWGKGVPEYENKENRPQGGYEVFALPEH